MVNVVEFERLGRAVKWAAKLHLGQFREGPHSLPYITHPIEVLTNLRYVGGVTDEPMLITAVLHDTIEEGCTTETKIREKFGDEVGGLVKELTRYEPTAEEIKGMTSEQIWQMRSDLLLGEIAKMSDAAKAVKLADRLSNLREAYRSKSGKKLERYVRQTKKILGIVDESVNPLLWRQIRSELRD